MEPALKQRLLGAAVLVALAVIFLPMFFGGETSKPDDAGVSLDIPAEPDTKLQSRVYDLPLPDASAPAVVPEAPVAGDAAEVMPLSEVPSDTAVTPPAVVSTGAPAAVAKPDAGTKPVVDAAPVVESRPVTPVPVKPPVTSPGIAGAQDYLVSLGVYSDRGSAESLLARARKLGFPAYLESLSVNGKAASGVRVGPFDGRASAEAARLKLKDAIGNAEPSLMVADRTVTAAAPARSQVAGVADGWAVQLSALRDRKDAETLSRRVKAAGFEAFVDDTRGADGTTLWRVRVGPRAERADAEKLAADIKVRLHMDGMVVTHP